MSDNSTLLSFAPPLQSVCFPYIIHSGSRLQFGNLCMNLSGSTGTLVLLLRNYSSQTYPRLFPLHLTTLHSRGKKAASDLYGMLSDMKSDVKCRSSSTKKWNHIMIWVHLFTQEAIIPSIYSTKTTFYLAYGQGELRGNISLKMYLFSINPIVELIRY